MIAMQIFAKGWQLGQNCEREVARWKAANPIDCGYPRVLNGQYVGCDTSCVGILSCRISGDHYSGHQTRHISPVSGRRVTDSYRWVTREPQTANDSVELNHFQISNWNVQPATKLIKKLSLDAIKGRKKVQDLSMYLCIPKASLDYFV